LRVKRVFVEIPARLVAVKRFKLRIAGNLRIASSEDRRFRLHNSMVKRKVTCPGCRR